MDICTTQKEEEKKEIQKMNNDNVVLIPLTLACGGGLTLSKLRPRRIITRRIFNAFWCDHPITVNIDGTTQYAYQCPFAGWYIVDVTKH